jgi:hypothetical protein
MQHCNVVFVCCIILTISSDQFLERNNRIFLIIGTEYIFFEVGT